MEAGADEKVDIMIDLLFEESTEKSPRFEGVCEAGATLNKC